MRNGVGVLMGSYSDFPQVESVIITLREFGVPFEAKVASAHRTPEIVREWATAAPERDLGVLIAAAGGAAHLAGVVAGFTILPVIGLPIGGTALSGFDSLLSMVQMPAGIPVATVAVGGAINAALLAVQILAVGDDALAAKLRAHREKMRQSVVDKDALLRQKLRLNH
ncbi:MAG: 5-(carboxyamino)imidazole ribonucleotide mutase [Planctomycetota bacterium]|jgi:5-(carboxyamino)imidazole ribonucleotide mutase|nr:5-(carboxyamino)imidazole ribonucleotide mutase [Planctomycetota bacterium]